MNTWHNNGIDVSARKQNSCARSFAFLRHEFDAFCLFNSLTLLQVTHSSLRGDSVSGKANHSSSTLLAFVGALRCSSFAVSASHRDHLRGFRFSARPSLHHASKPSQLIQAHHITVQPPQHFLPESFSSTSMGDGFMPELIPDG